MYANRVKSRGASLALYTSSATYVFCPAPLLTISFSFVIDKRPIPINLLPAFLFTYPLTCGYLPTGHLWPLCATNAERGALHMRGYNTRLELCADVIVSAAARRSISVGGGAPPGPKKTAGGGGGGAAWGQKHFF